MPLQSVYKQNHSALSETTLLWMFVMNPMPFEFMPLNFWNIWTAAECRSLSPKEDVKGDLQLQLAEVILDLVVSWRAMQDWPLWQHFFQDICILCGFQDILHTSIKRAMGRQELLVLYHLFLPESLTVTLDIVLFNPKYWHTCVIWHMIMSFLYTKMTNSRCELQTWCHMQTKNLLQQVIWHNWIPSYPVWNTV